MLSRVANSLYWMARYVERAENTARFIDVTLNLILDQPDGVPQWEPLVATTGDTQTFAERYGEFSGENVIRFLTFDREYPNSILSSIATARENARTIRDQISSEAWEQLNEFHGFVREADRGPDGATSLFEFFSAVKQHSHLFSGVLDATITRDTGWHFANLGRLLERADKTSRLLDVKYFTLLPQVGDIGTTIDDLQWSAVLRSVSGFELYRKRYHTITVERVVQFLILDAVFPRAIHACITRADESLHEIGGSPIGSYRNRAEQHLGRLKSELAYADVDAIVDRGLHEFTDDLQRKLNETGAAIYETFFALRPAGSSQEQSQS